MEGKIIKEDSLKMNYFKDNHALYGKNYASYPIKVKMQKTKEMFVKNKHISIKAQSGIQIGSHIKFAIYDHFNQIVELNFYELSELFNFSLIYLIKFH